MSYVIILVEKKAAVSTSKMKMTLHRISTYLDYVRSPLWGSSSGASSIQKASLVEPTFLSLKSSA